MDIGCFEKDYVRRNNDGTEEIDIYTPSFLYSQDTFPEYEVLPHEEGRIDLVMESIYGEYNYKHLDVILYLNDIDNPLSVRSGMMIRYPAQTNLEDYRWTREQDPVDKLDKTKRLSKPNKTSKVDPSRQYSLPPTVNPNPGPSVRTSNNAIVAGGF
jgi:hypothetical protein